MSIIDKIKSLFKKHKTEQQETTSNTEDEERLKRAILVAQELEQYETKHNLLAIMKREYKLDFIEALDTFGYAELLECIEEEVDEDYIAIEQRLISFIFKEEVPEDKRQEIKESTAKLFNITMALYEERMEAERQKMFAYMWHPFSASRNVRPSGMPYAIRDYERNYRRD